MKILLVSDSPFCVSGYAQIALPFAHRAVKAGYEVTYFATSYHGQPQCLDGVKLLGGLTDGFGNDLLAKYAESEQADCIMTFKDPYVYQQPVLESLPCAWFPITPVDTEPLGQLIAHRIKPCERPIALTRLSFDQLVQAGYKPFYAPLFIDTAFYHPMDKREARERLGLPSNAFVIAFVGANQSRPSRKGIDKIIMSFSRWMHLDHNNAKRHQDAVLYLHTDLSQERGGEDLINMLNYHAIPEMNWKATDQLAYIGGVEREVVRDVYNAADVLFNPAMGGGFELCGVEAQACGTPVITNNFTAMRETVWSGWKIDITNNDLDWNGMHYGYRANPPLDRLVKALNLAYQHHGDENLKRIAVEKAGRYDINHVFDTYWLSVLKRIEKIVKPTVTIARLSPVEVAERILA